MSRFMPRDEEPPYDDLLDILMIIGITVFILFGAFFGYFAFDFLDDFFKGVKWNQTTYENYKKLIGARVRPFGLKKYLVPNKETL